MTHSATTSRTRLTRTLALAAGLAALLPLAACSTPSGEGAASDTLRVVATTTQLADMVSEVGGADVELHGLMSPGASAHHFDPSPADLLALAEADVLVVNGLELESFVDSATEASGFDGEIITASNGIDLHEAEHISEEMAGSGHTDDHDHADEADADDADHDDTDHDEADHAEADHAEAAGHEGHNHGSVNPHIWTSPRQVEGMVAEIARGLAGADPAHASDYEQRSADYTARLTALDLWATEQFERVPAEERVIVTGHDSLSYYLHDYGITFAGSILPSFEDNAEPSATEIDDLVAEIKTLGVKAIFVESSMSPKLARTIAREAGVEVVDADALYADALGVAGSGAETYIDATVHNTRVILEAWGIEPEPVPAAVTA